MDATWAQDAGGTASPQEKSGSMLDRRREKLQASQATAADAHSEVRRLDQQLESNDDNRREREAALQAALDRAAVLKKAIKASTKEAAKLRAARKEAGERAAKAQQRVSAAEAKYDRAVLADMVRREKENDLLAHAITETGVLDPGRAAPLPALDSPSSVGPDQTVTDVSGAPSDPVTMGGTDTARATAARHTADRAHVAIQADLSGVSD